MRQEKDALDAFMVDRALLIDRRKSGKRGFEQSRPETGVLKTTLKKRQRYTEALVPPAPQLVPYDEYIAKYERVMKKAGNKVQRIQGRKFVVIPPEAGTPWTLRREYGNDVIKDNIVNDGSESGIESGVDDVKDPHHSLT